jgi:hypothetical protein
VTKVRTIPLSAQRRTVEGETPSRRQAAVSVTHPWSFVLAVVLAVLAGVGIAGQNLPNLPNLI